MYLPRAAQACCAEFRHAMQALRDRGLIITIHGRGTFVAASAGDAG